MITIKNEKERGCGHRKAGGLYLVDDAPSHGCNKLPVEIKPCETCAALGLNCRVHQTRGWSWINPAALIPSGSCGQACLGPICGLYEPPKRGGLLWVGESFYKTTSDFNREAHEQGICKRVSAIPKGFVVGTHHVLLAHPKAVSLVCHDCNGTGNALAPVPGETEHGVVTKEGEIIPTCVTCKGVGAIQAPGIFRMFKPSRIEYILKGDETSAEIADLEKRGLTTVRLVRDDGQDAAAVHGTVSGFKAMASRAAKKLGGRK